MFRFTILHSLALVTIIGLMTYAQAYYFPWMIPKAAAIVGAAATGQMGSAEYFMVIASAVVILGTAAIALRRRLPHPPKADMPVVTE